MDRIYHGKNNPEADKNLSFGAPAARMVVKVEYTDGTGQYIVTDGEWKNSTGPIVFELIIYGGEIYDSRYSIEGWTAMVIMILNGQILLS